MSKYHDHFEVDRFYHVFNRTNGEDLLFREEENYRFFLRKCDEYLSDYLDIWAYSLIPNHFHLLCRIREIDEETNLKGFGNLSGFISQKFSNFFNSYTKSFNKLYDRHGSLFQKPFKHIKVDSRNYLKILIHYIHHNPIHHGYVSNFSSWGYSSYNAILSKAKTKISRNKLLNLFASKEYFYEFHQELKDYKSIHHLIIE